MKDKGIVAIYLAAGKSRRMGGNKLALQLGASTIGNSGLQRALMADLEHIIVVTKDGDALEWIDAALFRAPYRNRWTFVICRDAEKGQAHSLQCGLRAAMKMNPKGMMILLADQPLLSVSIINDLVLRYVLVNQEKENNRFVAASFQGIPRPPIIFSPAAVPELLKLKGDEGARQLFRMKTPLEGLFIDYENGWDFFDVDTKEEYEWLAKDWRARVVIRQGAALKNINKMNKEVFVATVGWVFEHSPWVAEKTWESLPFQSREILWQTMVANVQNAEESLKLELLRAHPDLGTRLKMSEVSQKEQAGIGLDQLPKEEFIQFVSLNQSYVEKFGFPFIMAVKGQSKDSILAAMKQRVSYTYEEECVTALNEVFKIASFRLNEVIQ